MKNNNKILITGITGQDGIILSSLLVKKKYEVIGFALKKIKKKTKNITYLNVDLKKKQQIKKILNIYAPTHLIHFGSSNPSYGDKEKFFYKNYITTKNLIDAILESKKNINFIFSNSSHIFKKKNYVTEKDSFKIGNDYTKFRIKIYKYLMLKKKTDNFKFCNLILFNHDSKYRKDKFLIPRLVKNIKNNNLNFIKNIYKENIQADFSHAEDICNAIYLIIKKNIVIDNLILSSGEKTKVNDIINYIIKRHFKMKEIQKLKIKKNDNFVIGNNRLAKELLNWKIKKNIFTAVDEMIKYKS
jgi:GDPmannose 4,6-dehydratase